MSLQAKISTLVEAKPLTTKKRDSLPSSAFVFPKARKFPIHDLAHAKNALSRASAIGGKVKEAVFRAVHTRYPELKSHSVTASLMDDDDYKHHLNLATKGSKISKRILADHHTQLADINKKHADKFSNTNTPLSYHYRNLQDAHENLAEHYSK